MNLYLLFLTYYHILVYLFRISINKQRYTEKTTLLKSGFF